MFETSPLPCVGCGTALDTAIGGDAASLARAMIIFGFTDSQIERSGETGSEYVYSPFRDAAVRDSDSAAAAARGLARVHALASEGRALPLSAVLAIARGRPPARPGTQRGGPASGTAAP